MRISTLPTARRHASIPAGLSARAPCRRAVKASGKLLLEQDFSGWENEKWQTGTLEDVNTLWDMPPEAGAQAVNNICGVKEKRMLFSKRGMLVEIKKGSPRLLKCSIMEAALAFASRAGNGLTALYGVQNMQVWIMQIKRY
jgi:hypothetical protein